MKDFLYSGRLEKLNVAVSYGVFTDLCNEVVTRHDCDPVSAHLLGRALGAGCLSASVLKPEERVNVHWAYEGSLKALVVDAGAEGDVRGFITPRHLAQEADSKDQLFGDKAQLRVIRTKNMHVLSSGTSESIFQDPVQDLEHAYGISDQVETAITVMIGFSQDPEKPVALCQGLLLQALPDCDLELFDRLRQGLNQDAARQLLSQSSDSDNYIEDLIHAVMNGEKKDLGLKLMDRPAPYFQCSCKREKMSAVLRVLPYEDRMEIAKKKEDVIVHCEFCNERYTLTLDDCVRAWNRKPSETE